MTSRKLHTLFRLVPKSMTLDDPQRPFRTLFQNTCVFRALHENLNEGRPILSAANMSRNDFILVSGNIRFMWIFVRVLGDEASNDSGVIENVDFQGFRTLRLRTLENEANIII